VTDHCSYYAPRTLELCAGSAGMRIVNLAVDWAPKEISACLTNAEPEASKKNPQDAFDLNSVARRSIQWLQLVVDHAMQEAAAGKLGIFGTATAGTWLAAMLGEGVQFFVDEDVLRVGKTHMGFPVVHPSDVPRGSKAYLAFTREQGKRIRDRLSKEYPWLKLILAPDFEHRKSGAFGEHVAV
jgi:hypothetical protein